MSTGEQPLALPATARQAADALLAGKYHTGVPELLRADRSDMANEVLTAGYRALFPCKREPML
jgi:hypothetical protein